MISDERWAEICRRVAGLTYEELDTLHVSVQFAFDSLVERQTERARNEIFKVHCYIAPEVEETPKTRPFPFKKGKKDKKVVRL